MLSSFLLIKDLNVHVTCIYSYFTLLKGFICNDYRSQNEKSLIRKELQGNTLIYLKPWSWRPLGGSGSHWASPPLLEDTGNCNWVSLATEISIHCGWNSPTSIICCPLLSLKKSISLSSGFLPIILTLMYNINNKIARKYD